MTKREEIREGIASQIGAETNGGYLEYWDEFRTLLAEDQQKEYFKCIADVILEFLHSQGVVLKVDRELPNFCKFECDKFKDIPKDWDIRTKGDTAMMEYYEGVISVTQRTQGDMIEAGYVAVEPLVVA